MQFHKYALICRRYLLPLPSGYTSVLKVEGAGYFETSVPFYQTVHHHEFYVTRTIYIPAVNPYPANVENMVLLPMLANDRWDLIWCLKG